MIALVTGATGTIGRTLVARLASEGVQVRAVSRNTRAGVPGGQMVADTSDLAGVEVLFVHPRAVGLGVGELVARAKAAGVRRLVVLSAVNVDDPFEDQPSRIRGDRNAEVERAVVNSGLETVVLRAEVFASNTFGTIAPQLHHGDVVRAAFAEAVEPMIDERDIGEVAAEAMVGPTLAGRQLVLSGPESLTLAERVLAIGELTGRALRFEEISAEAAIAGIMSAGLPAEFAQKYVAMQLRSLSSPPLPSADVQSVLGRPATSFPQWARDHREMFSR